VNGDVYRNATRFSKAELEASLVPPQGMKSLRQVDEGLKENWYIACLATELDSSNGRPISSVVYESPLVLYRDENNVAVAMFDRCMHRGAKLSEGTCKSGKLRCPYHGWAYGASGEVCEVPSEGPSFQKKNWRGRTLPTVEQDGVIWVWPGDTDPTLSVQTARPSWRFPFADSTEWTGYFMVTDFENEVTHLVENFMDVPHTVFVHDKWFRSRSEIKVPITVEVGSGRVLVTYDQPKDSIGFSSKMMNPRNEPMVHTDEFIFPNITRVDYRFGKRGYVINSQCTPIGRYKTRVYTWITYHLFSGAFGRVVNRQLRPAMNFYTRQVIEQDVDIMKNQGRNLQRLDEQGQGAPFKSTAADELHIAIERLREFGRLRDERVHSTAWTKERELWI
jgi:phenylpropionate dioxygenase-like ring-hydroxylating dioxygenase large terminal subunit